MNPPLDDEYNPKMYVKSGYEFNEAPDNIEDAMNKFERDVPQA